MVKIEVINSKFLQLSFKFLQHLGVDVKQICTLTNIPIEAIKNPDMILPMHPCWHFIEMATKEANLTDYGFRADEYQKLSWLFDQNQDISTYTLLNAIQEYIDTGTKYTSKVFDFNFQLYPQSQGVWFNRFIQSPNQLALEAMEQLGIAQMIRLVRLVAGNNWQPLAIIIKHNDDKQVFKKYYPHIPISKDPERSGILIEHSLLSTIDKPLLLKSAKVQESELKFSSFKSALTWVLSIYKNDTLPSLKHIEKYIGLSEKQVQYRLAQEQTHFNNIREELVISIAKEKLTLSDIKISELAINLGYQYDTNFIRAFKKKVGVSPHQYRKVNQSHK